MNIIDKIRVGEVENRTSQNREKKQNNDAESIIISCRHVCVAHIKMRLT